MLSLTEALIKFFPIPYQIIHSLTAEFLGKKSLCLNTYRNAWHIIGTTTNTCWRKEQAWRTGLDSEYPTSKLDLLKTGVGEQSGIGEHKNTPRISKDVWTHVLQGPETGQYLILWYVGSKTSWWYFWSTRSYHYDVYLMQQGKDYKDHKIWLGA